MVVPCGHSFSKASIERWVQTEGKRFCPLCKKPLTMEDIRPNYSLRDAVSKCVSAIIRMIVDLSSSISVARLA